VGRPFVPQTGWYAAVDLDLVGVHISNGLIAPVALDGIVDTVHLNTAQLDWTGSPRLEIGYRFGEGCGEVSLGYRSLVTEGSDNFLGADGVDFLKSRLNMNVVDLDYASREFLLGPEFGLKWRAGIRFASVYFDSRSQGVDVEERTSNSFIGAGPRVGLDLAWRPCAVPAISLFGKVDTSVVVGHIQQSFEETVTADDLSLVGGATNMSGTQVVPVFHLQAGLGYTPLWGDNQVHLALGYEFDQWWSVGRVGGSRANLTGSGFFLRTEFRF
jgi:hypothetical protein